MSLVVSEISKTFLSKGKTIPAVRNISFNLDEGKTLAILGPNGAGKTTLISMLCGLLTPDAGQVNFKNRCIYSHQAKYLSKIGAVLEGNRNIYWYMTVGENLEYFSRLSYLDSRKIKFKSSELIEFFGLGDFRSIPVGQFSRGMQQKVAIAVAMMNEPELLFLDEPTLGLDVIAKEKMISHLNQISEVSKTSIIITSHQLDVVDKVADEVMMIHKGGKLHHEDKEKLKIMLSKQSYEIVFESSSELEMASLIRGDVILKESRNDNIYTITIENYSSQNEKVCSDFIKEILRNNGEIKSARNLEVDLENLFIQEYKIEH